MKLHHYSIYAILIISVLSGCNSKNSSKKETIPAIIDSVSVNDTGFTGIKKYMGGKYLIKEVTFKNGVREGLMKAFYMTGEVRQTFIYHNGLREDSSIWFFQEGQKFRSTPYIHDTIDGIQRQYFRTGQLRAKIGYSKGARTNFFQEFNPDGKLIGGYPSLVVNVTDEYKKNGSYKISLELSNKSVNVRYWKSELSGERFDTAHCIKINAIKGIGTLSLKKSGSPKPATVNIFAEILTNFGNNFLVYKKIDLPYKDLK
jgi:hypothetical protein